MAERPTRRGPVRVVIVDDHAMFRGGVRAELASPARLVDVLAEARRRRRRRSRRSPTHQPDVVLLDVHLPGGGGVEVMRRSRRRASPDTRYLALSRQRRGRGRHRHDPRRRPRLRHQDHHRPRAGRTRSAGCADGDAVFSPRLAGFVLDAFAGSIEVAAVDEDLDRLTEREREVMRLIARGYAYKEVAKELFISIKTVETHMSSVLRKLQLSSRHELTRWASDRRLL